MWTYMMQHVLVSKGIWNIVQGIDVRPGSENVGNVTDVASLAARIAAVRVVLPTTEQARWDVKDAQAHVLIVQSVKRTNTLHICSTKFAKQAWDILAGLYVGCNEAKIALLRKELESKIMNEEDDMDTFLAGVKDINEQLIFAGEVISDSSVMQTVLDALPNSYQTFASPWKLMNQRNPEVVKFDEVCTLLLQEALSKKNRYRQHAVKGATCQIIEAQDDVVEAKGDATANKAKLQKPARGGRQKQTLPRRLTRSTVVALKVDNEDVSNETIMEKGTCEDCVDTLKYMFVQARKGKQGLAILPSKRRKKTLFNEASQGVGDATEVYAGNDTK
ncbi:hypothetical protein L7F22_060605 [Adiantum nelumboides]|nr:hypothetical protein [Adiantum nelumboides]